MASMSFPFSFFSLCLPAYELDFGRVGLQEHYCHNVRAFNVSNWPMTILTKKAALSATGFQVDLSTVKDLPGMPRPEAIEFQVSFYARRLLPPTVDGVNSADLPMEKVEALLKKKEGKQEATVHLKVQFASIEGYHCAIA